MILTNKAAWVTSKCLPSSGTLHLETIQPSAKSHLLKEVFWLVSRSWKTLSFVSIMPDYARLCFISNLKEVFWSEEHEVTGLTPAEILFGRTLLLPCDILFGRPSETPSSRNEYMKNLEARLESVHAFARERIKLASERMKTRYDSRATDHHFKDGDLVWMYNPKRRRGLSPKLQQNWEGPYTVVKKLNE
ncbi:hypothetical protein AVEN_116684-1 [Araneus ventricosus]|uniref:Retrovirus-related Pol polyprotein from transposon 412 n=1 Tax=Araneus ventricosus TaxID=182803 RepID=A0A4Y2L6M9_ARAVE|nr:hypothetical protein AVEN_116684-1 [Araneus ventricosus]